METAYASQQLTRVGENLYRNGNGTYYAKLKKHGRQYKKSLDTHDRQTAGRKLADFEKEVERQAGEGPDLQFEEIAKKWLASIKPHLKASSHLRRETCVNQLLRYFKGRTLREIKHEHFERWQLKRTKVAAQTFNLDRETLFLIFAYAIKLKAVVVPPTREQFKELIAVMRQNVADRTKEAPPFIEFLAYTGMRLEEALSVQWRHIDFTKGSILITGGEVGTKNHSQRSIPLFDPARALLKRMREGKEIVPTATLFTHRSSKTALQHASAAIGLPEGEHFCHHDMRHFFCSNAIELNIPDHVIAAWLGHRDGGILVRKTYGHLRESHATEMARLMKFAA
jgi:integrase